MIDLTRMSCPFTYNGSYLRLSPLLNNAAVLFLFFFFYLNLSNTQVPKANQSEGYLLKLYTRLRSQLSIGIIFSSSNLLKTKPGTESGVMNFFLFFFNCQNYTYHIINPKQ